jgi:hypothetical protein
MSFVRQLLGRGVPSMQRGQLDLGPVLTEYHREPAGPAKGPSTSDGHPGSFRSWRRGSPVRTEKTSITGCLPVAGEDHRAVTVGAG